MMTTPLRGAVAVAYALLLLLLLASASSASSSSSFLGRYRRSASLDRATGIASSKESSAVPIASRLFQRALVGAWRGAGSEDPSTTNADENDDDGAEDDSSSAALLKWVERWAQQYPTWLCSGSVTGGLLRAVLLVEEAPGGSNNNKKANKPQQPPQRTQRSAHRRTGKEAVEIRTRIGNVHLLTFGPCRMSQRITYRESLSSNGDGGKEGSVRSRKTSDGRHHVLTSHCTVALPVTGGILALSPPPGRGGRHSMERGALLFSLKKQWWVVDVSTAEAGSKDDDDDNAVDATTVAARKKKRDPAGLRLQLSSALTGYRPALAGVSLPIPHWRKALYLNTQAALHGYIMWRFHRFGWAGANLIGGGKEE
jgi:hypothetical protein